MRLGMAFGLLTERIAESQRTVKARSREEPNDLYETADLFPEDTGLPMTVWVSPRGRARHAARIKVCRVPGNKMVPSNTVAMRIEPEPGLIKGKLPSQYLEPVTRWIAENRETLLKYWDGEIGTGALIGRLKKLGSSGPNR
jgi:hypothetical protein